MPAPILDSLRGSGRASPAVPPPPPAPGLLEGLAANFTAQRNDQPGHLNEEALSAYGEVMSGLTDMGFDASRYVNASGRGFGDPINYLAIWNDVERARHRDPKAFASLPATQREFDDQWKERFRQRAEATEQVAGRAGIGSRLAGGFVGAMTDPVNIGTLPVGGWGKTLAMRVLTEGLANAGLEAAQQPFISAERQRQGREGLSGEQMAYNVAGAAAFGAAFRGAVEVAPHVGPRFHSTVMANLDKLPDGVRERYLAGRYAKADDPAALADVVEALIGPENLSDMERSALVVARGEAADAAGNPFAGNGAGAALHGDLLAESWSAALATNPMDTSARAMVRAMPQPAGPAPTFAVAGEGAIDRYMARVGGVESGGNDMARNPRSSATGRYQFTRRTWLHYYKRRFGAGELSDDAILAKRGDGAIQNTLMRDLTGDNAASLRKAGIVPDEGNLYLAHFAGPEGARRLHMADPEASAGSVLGREVVEANPFLRDMTAREVVAWAHRKMGSSGGRADVVLRPDFGADGEAARVQAQLDEALGRAARLADEQRQAGAEAGGGLSDTMDAMAQPVERADLPELPAQPVEPRAMEPEPARPEVLAILPRMRDIVDNERGRSLNRVGELADELGVAEQDVRDALGEMVRERRLTVNRKTGNWMRKPPADTGPEDVLDFVARMGGVRDDEGHGLGLRGVSARERRELHPAAIKNVRRRREGGGKRDWQRMTRRNGPLLRHEGLSLDQIGELLDSHGYLHGADGGRPSTADVLDYLDQRINAGKPVYPMGEDGTAKAVDWQAEWAAREEQAALDGFLSEWDAAGLERDLIDADTMQLAAQLYGDDPTLTVAAAAERATMAQFDAVSRDLLDETGDAVYGGDYVNPFDDAHFFGTGGFPDGTGGGGPARQRGDAGAGGQAGEDAARAADAAEQGEALARLTPEDRAPFLDPDGQAAKLQADSLEHDARAARDATVSDAVVSDDMASQFARAWEQGDNAVNALADRLRAEHPKSQFAIDDARAAGREQMQARAAQIAESIPKVELPASGNSAFDWLRKKADIASTELHTLPDGTLYISRRWHFQGTIPQGMWDGLAGKNAKKITKLTQESDWGGAEYLRVGKRADRTVEYSLQEYHPVGAETTGPSITDAGGQADFAAPTQDQTRIALERQGEGRMKADVAQKAPGSDGGLFDVQAQDLSFRFEEEGAEVSLRDLLDGLDAEDAELKNIRDCL